MCVGVCLARTPLHTHHQQKMRYFDDHLSDRRTFLAKNEQPDVGLEPTTLRFLRNQRFLEIKTFLEISLD